MFPLATRIAVRIAVVQVLLIVFCVLGPGATQDWWLIAKQHPPALINWVMHWGVSLMWIPVAWTIWFLKIHRSTDTSEDLKRLATQVGLILAGMLLALMLWSCLSVLGSFGGHDPDKQVEDMAMRGRGGFWVQRGEVSRREFGAN